MSNLKPFIATAETKDQAIERAASYRAANKFQAFGMYYKADRGGDLAGMMYFDHLADGENMEDHIHQAGERLHRIPAEIIAIANNFFHLLHDHLSWPELFYSAIKPGADISHAGSKLALHMLEEPEWLAGYACARGSYLTGYMHSIFTMRMQGIDVDGRLRAVYNDYFYKMHRHQFEGFRSTDRYVMAALRAMTQGGSQSGSWSHFIQNAAKGSAIHMDQPYLQRCAILADKFLQIIRES